MKTHESIRLCFVRHAQARADDGSYGDETPLSVVGERQAVLLGQALINRGTPAAVYSSPYPRCLETARPLCAALGLAPRVDRRLREFELDRCTLVHALTRPDLLIWDSMHRGRPDGESLGEFSGRVASFLDETVEEYLGAEVIVVTHSGVIDAAMRWCMGMPSDAPWLHDLPLSNASVTEVEFWPRGRVEGGAPRYSAIVRIGDVVHLSDCASEI